MITVINNLDIDNAPKKLLLESFNEAFINKDIEALSGLLTDSFVWTLNSNIAVTGKDVFYKELKKLDFIAISAIVLDQVLTHGREGAVRGTCMYEDGSEKPFAHFYVFGGATGGKIKECVSFI